MAIVLYTAEKYVGQVWTYAYHAASAENLLRRYNRLSGMFTHGFVYVYVFFGFPD